MKLGKKLMVLMLAGLMSFGAAACTGGDTTSIGGGNNPGGTSEAPIEGVDNPYTLKVFSFTGGYGEEWLNTLVSRYKRERAGKEFTINGKTYDGVEFELEVLDSMDYKGQTFVAFLPANMDEEDPDYGIIILRSVIDEKGEELFESIDDDDELQDVYEHFAVLLFDDEDEE